MRRMERSWERISSPLHGLSGVSSPPLDNVRESRWLGRTVTARVIPCLEMDDADNSMVRLWVRPTIQGRDGSGRSIGGTDGGCMSTSGVETTVMETWKAGEPSPEPGRGPVTGPYCDGHPE